MHGNDLTQGNISKQLWSLAWPIMLSIFFHTLYNIVDAFWVSKLSAQAIAAVSISQIALVAMISLSMGITIGSGVLMAMSIGAKDIEGAQKILGQSFVLAFIAAIIFTVIALVFRSEFLSLAGATGTILAPALDYFTITAAGSVLLFLMMCVVFGFNAQGDNFTMTKIFALSTLVNTILDPLMIFGFGPIPALGVAGAAYATLISQFIAVGLGLFILSRKEVMIRFRWRNLVFESQKVKQVLKIGLPASLTQVLMPIGVAALTSIVALRFAEAGAVSYTLGFRIEFFAFLPAIGFGFAAMAMMGQNIGAGNIGRAREVYKKALLYGVTLAAGLGLLSAIFSRQILGLFTSDPLIVDYARGYLLGAPISFAFLAMMIVAASSFQGVGKSWPGFWITLIKFALVAIPLSYFLTIIMGFGINAVWISILIGNLVAGLIGYFWLKESLKKFHIPSTLPHSHDGSIPK